MPKLSLLDSPISVQAVEFIDRLKDSINDIEEAKEIVKSEFKDKTDLIIRGLTKVEAFWQRVCEVKQKKSEGFDGVARNLEEFLQSDLRKATNNRSKYRFGGKRGSIVFRYTKGKV